MSVAIKLVGFQFLHLATVGKFSQTQSHIVYLQEVYSYYLCVILQLHESTKQQQFLALKSLLQAVVSMIMQRMPIFATYLK